MIHRLTDMIGFSLLTVIATFGFQTVATHILSEGDFGMLATWLTSLGLVGVFLMLGLDASLVYFAKQGQRFEENIGMNLLVYVAMFLLLAAGVSVLGLDMGFYLTLFYSITCISITGVFSAYYLFHEKFRYYNLILFSRAMLLLMAFGFIFLLKLRINALSTFLVYSVMASIVMIVVIAIYLQSASINFKLPGKGDSEYFLYGFKGILNKVLSIGLYSSTIYCLNSLADVTDVAFFFVASSIAKMGWIVPDSAGNILYPKFLQSKMESEKTAVKEEMFKYARIVFLINIAAVFFFWLFGRHILGLLYSDSYQVVFGPVLLLLIGNQGMVYYKILSRYLVAQNRWRPLYISLGVAITFNVALNFLLIPLLGLWGAVVATAFSFWSCGLVLSVFVRNSFCQFLNVVPVYNEARKLLAL